MKKAPIFLIVCIATSLSIYGQTYLPFDSVTNKIAYKTIVKNDTLSASRGYKEGLNWLQQYMDTLKTKKSSELYVQKKDEDSSKIVATGKFLTTYVDNFDNKELWVYYTMIVESKNGRTRLKITDLQHDDISAGKAKNQTSFEQTYYGLKEKNKNIQTAWLGFFTRCDNILKSTLTSYEKYILRPALAVAKPDIW